MVINHNLAALNTYSKLSQADFDKSRSLEKLSSGLRINKAGDDAAGLAISEKMRSQIKGLNQASRNTQDGISMIQTAEGALNETHSILQRMRELAVQSANDTNTTQDRTEIQNEIGQLSSEINRIAGTTEFNKQLLLDGTGSETSVTGATVANQNAGKNVTQAVFEVKISSITNGCTHCFTINCNDGGGSISVNVNVCYIGAISNAVTRIATGLNSCQNLTCQWDIQARGDTLVFTSKRSAHDTTSNSAINACTAIFCAGGCGEITICVAEQTQEASCAMVNRNYLTLSDSILKEGVQITIGDKSAVFFNATCGNYESEADMRTKLNLSTDVCVIDLNAAASNTVDEVLTCLAGLTSTCTTIAADTTNNRLCIKSDCGGTNQVKYSTVAVGGLAGTGATSGNGKTLQIGANADQTFKVYFGDGTGKGIGISADAAGTTRETKEGKTAYFAANPGVTDTKGQATEYALDVTTAEKASAAISALDDAISEISARRSKMGAYQNRLEHTINNLNASSENLTAAESRIRDVDMAKEMMEFTKNNILTQASTSMLAQANQQTQGVLSLLK